MKRILSILMATMVAISILTGCEMQPTSDEKQQSQQEEMLQQATDQLGMPNIVNFQEKKLMKNIMEQADRTDLICYVYTFSQYTGKYTYIGRCVGFGLPYGTEYTNPQKVEFQHGTLVTLPQADPNGLYKPADVSATWINMIDESTGDKYLMLTEPDMTVTAHKLPKETLNNIPNNY